MSNLTAITELDVEQPKSGEIEPNFPTLPDQNLENLERAKTDPNLAHSTYPSLYNPLFLIPCTVRILMVTDGRAGFGQMNEFGLSELLNALSISPGPWVRFAVTKAHRGIDPNGAADINNFKFTNHDLFAYQEIWLFGVERNGSFYSMTDAELKALAQFMDQGGGVFGTGDHEDLGVAMCGRVPRIRSMRKWYWPNPGPNGEPVAPNVAGLNRHDTLREGHDLGYQSDDQSDDIPQYIQPKWYYSGHPYCRRFHPHPLLDGPYGVIKVLPDHMHEGECYVPTDLTKTFSFVGYTTTEYPALPNGNRVAPEVIAWANVIGRPDVNARTFGVIGAYEGHQVNVGRVAVDSTWHHCFNINLRGTPSGSTGVKKLGFYASESGGHAYEDIKSYFRNIGVWLAPKYKQRCMFKTAVWCVRWSYPLIEELPSIEELSAVEKLDSSVILNLGSMARDALIRIAPQSLIYQWVLQLAQDVLPQPTADILAMANPWSQEPSSDSLMPGFVGETVINAILGATVVSISGAFSEGKLEDKAVAEKLLDQVISASTLVGMRVASEFLASSSSATEKFTNSLSEAIKEQGHKFPFPEIKADASM